MLWVLALFLHVAGIFLLERSKDHLHSLFPEFVFARGAQRGTAQASPGFCYLSVPRRAQSAYSRNEMKLDIHELMNPALRKPIAQSSCNLKFPHECRLDGGHIKGSWNAIYWESSSV